MAKTSPFYEFISLARAQFPEAEFDFLQGAIYSETLTQQAQQDYLQLIEYARLQQIENPFYESVYHLLLHLYVLNGSRIDVLARLDRRLRGLAAGQASLILISGKAGIGKTSLVMALSERIRQMGGHLIVARCSDQISTSYAVWNDITFAIASAMGVSLDALPAPFGTAPTADSPQHLIRSLARWLDKTAATRPLVILLDDLHWVDIDSLEILNSLTSRDKNPPVLFIGTSRSDERNLEHPFYDYWPKLQRNRLFDHIQLELLTEDDVARLTTSYLGPCTAELSTYLFKRAEGHPLFTMALLNDLMESDLLIQNDEGLWLPPSESVPVPKLLSQLITQRVHRLGVEVEQLLTVAAVVGETWPLGIVEQLLDAPETQLLTALELALDDDLIAAEDEAAETFRFSHGLIKQVLYSRQLPRRRKRLHQQIGIQLEEQQEAQIYAKAYHFYEAENWVEAWRYCLAAGEQAANSFANHRAVDLYQNALDAALRAGVKVEARHYLKVYEHLGRTQRLLDQQQEAEITFSRMRDVAQSIGDMEAEGHALVHLSHVRIALYQYALAEQTAQEALHIAEQIDDVRLLAQVHGSLAKLLLVQGAFDAVDYHHKQFLHLTTNLSDPATKSSAFRQLAYKGIWTGEYKNAEALAQQSLAYARRAGVPLYIVAGSQIVSYAQIELGNYRQAYQHIRSFLDFDEISDPYHHQLPRLLNQMGYLYLELGNASEALIWDRQAAEASLNSQGQNRYEMQRYSLLNIATDLLHLGDIDGTMEAIVQFETIRQAPEFVQFRYYNRYLLLLAELHLAQNAFAQALELALEARDFALKKRAAKNIAKSHWLAGRAMSGMNKYDEAQVHLENAVDIADDLRHGSLRWKIRLSLAQARIDAGRSPDAVCQQARALMNRTSDGLLGSHLQKSFLSSPWITQIETLEEKPRPEQRGYPASLTEREVEVLRLVARGTTNQQIADTLYISVRTVNTHMTNILNKTGCDNRTAASAFAVQHNLVTT